MLNQAAVTPDVTDCATGTDAHNRVIKLRLSQGLWTYWADTISLQEFAEVFYAGSSTGHTTQANCAGDALDHSSPFRTARQGGLTWRWLRLTLKWIPPVDPGRGSRTGG